MASVKLATNAQRAVVAELLAAGRAAGFIPPGTKTYSDFGVKKSELRLKLVGQIDVKGLQKLRIASSYVPASDAGPGQITWYIGEIQGPKRAVPVTPEPTTERCDILPKIPVSTEITAALDRPSKEMALQVVKSAYALGAKFQGVKISRQERAIRFDFRELKSADPWKHFVALRWGGLALLPRGRSGSAFLMPMWSAQRLEQLNAEKGALDKHLRQFQRYAAWPPLPFDQISKIKEGQLVEVRFPDADNCIGVVIDVHRHGVRSPTRVTVLLSDVLSPYCGKCIVLATDIVAIRGTFKAPLKIEYMRDALEEQGAVITAQDSAADVRKYKVTIGNWMAVDKDLPTAIQKAYNYMSLED